MNPALVLALSGAQHVLHQVLAMDTKASEAFAPLDGRAIRVELTAPKIGLSIEFEQGKPWLNWAPGTPDVTLTGELSALVETARSLAKGNGAMVMEGIQVQGSVGVLKGLSDAAGQLTIDLEDELSKKLGDPIAGAMLMGAKAFYRQLKTQSESVKSQTEEYIRHEQNWLVSRDVFDDFSDRARRLRHRLERLERKV